MVTKKIKEVASDQLTDKTRKRNVIVFESTSTLLFSGSYNNSSSGANLTPYSGVIFRGVTLTPKRSLKNSFSGVKVTPDIEELK